MGEQGDAAADDDERVSIIDSARKLAGGRGTGMAIIADEMPMAY